MGKIIKLASPSAPQEYSEAIKKLLDIIDKDPILAQQLVHNVMIIYRGPDSAIGLTTLNMLDDIADVGTLEIIKTMIASGSIGLDGDDYD